MFSLEQAKLKGAITIEPIASNTSEERCDLSSNLTTATDADKGEMSSDQEEESSLLKCVICRCDLTSARNPKLMECLHSTCASCFKSKLESQNDSEPSASGLQCPRCEVFCNVQNVIDNHFVAENETDNDTDIKCNNCEDNAPVTNYCIECKDFICASCVEAHRRVKITKDHTLKEKEEAEAEVSANATNRTIVCTIHPNEQCTLFCENCNTVTCRDCQLNEHRDHKYKFVHEIASESRSLITGLLKEVTYKRVLLKSAMKVIDDRSTSIEDKKTAITSEITQACLQIVEAVKAQRASLIDRLNTACDSKKKSLKEKKGTLEELCDNTDHCINFVTDALNKGSDLSLLFSKKIITSHLLRIKARRADIPNPEIPVRLMISFDKLPELLKMVNGLGSLIVDNRTHNDGIKPVAIENLSPPPAPYPPATTYSAPNHYACSNGTARRPSSSPTLSLRQRASPPVRQFQNSTNPPPSSSSRGMPTRSPIYGMSSMVLGVRGMNPPMPSYPSNLHPRSTNPPQQHSLIMRPTNPSQQVTSSTHPSADMNMRSPHGCGSFQQILPAPYNQMYRIAGPKPIPPPNKNCAMFLNKHHSQHQQLPPPYPVAPPPQKTSSISQWHTPQQQSQASTIRIQSSDLSIDESFKIHLKSPNNHEPKANVTSTAPKTPSPITSKDDHIFQESVNDLMATIAKLDSNGIEVIPEGAQRVSTECTVDSSTEYTPNKTSEQKDDANEDWCAVCMDGGELICCDNCPKVFHVNCHIPVLDNIPEENEVWQCLLCSNVTNLVPPEGETVKRKHSLSFHDRKIAERILLELYCQYENSQIFREEPTDPHVLAKMPRVITLDMMRQKLKPENSEYYGSIKAFIRDVRNMFRYYKIAYPRDSAAYKSGRQLEAVFDRVLIRWIPNATEIIDIESGDETAPSEAKKSRRDGE